MTEKEYRVVGKIGSVTAMTEWFDCPRAEVTGTMMGLSTVHEWEDCEIEERDA